jgi:hypothetical protein
VVSNYGLEELRAPAAKQFRPAEAELALAHAEEWQRTIVGLGGLLKT